MLQESSVRVAGEHKGKGRGGTEETARFLSAAPCRMPFEINPLRLESYSISSHLVGPA